MKNILLIFILITFISCKSDKKEIAPEFKDSNLQLVEFLEKKIYLPKGFKKSSIEMFAELIENSPNKNELTEYELRKLENFKKMGESIEIFIQEDNYRNNISFQLGDYVQLTKEAVEVYVDLLENHLFVESESFGVERKRLESKFLSYGNSKVVKVKYLQTFGVEKIYLTQYLVTYKLKTFGIIISSETDNDYQYILNNFKK
ncbi:hypothetical protein VOI54_03910 [Tamlana sp. 2201CG12-4]|uniref:hypothetical protein n=1 Tax=Tamlana sp. 2201CG12-4 TaxID=3112582 RepID=UPI002DB71675|nr:hypothetical protein [Tamlana sp. 2201CG12-4]MEC3906149.1 hypothetical protein [Tamlana sp. 2201CG12-4]